MEHTYSIGTAADAYQIQFCRNDISWILIYMQGPIMDFDWKGNPILSEMSPFETSFGENIKQDNISYIIIDCLIVF